MKGIFYEGIWYEIGASCIVMPDDKQGIDTEIHPYWTGSTGLTVYGTNNFGLSLLPGGTRNGANGDFLYGVSTGYWWTDPYTIKDHPDSSFNAVRLFYDSNSLTTELSAVASTGYYVRAL